jgi:hypothetical protein
MHFSGMILVFCSRGGVGIRTRIGDRVVCSRRGFCWSKIVLEEKNVRLTMLFLDRCEGEDKKKEERFNDVAGKFLRISWRLKIIF